jgi:hypothetical protein
VSVTTKCRRLASRRTAGASTKAGPAVRPTALRRPFHPGGAALHEHRHARRAPGSPLVGDRHEGQQLTIEGSTAKNQQTRHIPLNVDALEALKRWKEQAPDGERVFPIDTGFKTAWAALLERAKITKFRWHDLRHHFASRLVQAGVPLNTVRELLGHGRMAMTLRYAHLAPDQKREAVDKLMQAVNRPTEAE